MTEPAPRPGRTGQLTLEWGHTPSHAEEDLILGEGNELAYRHILHFPDWPSPPWMLIEGPPSAGKSHLARIWAERAGAAMPEPSALEELATVGGTAPLVIEDVDSRRYDEDALFHLLNQSMRDGRPLVLTAREPVANWGFETDDLKSRARLAAHFMVSTSDDIQLSQMFVKLFGDRQIADAPAIVYIAAPAWSFHRDHDLYARALDDRIEMWRFELHQDWRKEISVISRLRYDDSPAGISNL